MSPKAKALLVPLLSLAIVGVLVIIAYTMPQPATQAAPLPGPTPIANIVTSDKALVVNFYSISMTQAAVNGSAIQLAGYNFLDLQYIVDQTVVTGQANTSTLKPQYSNDGTNWATGDTIVGNNSTDTNDLVRLANFGRYTRVAITVTNTNPVTWTVIGVAH